MAYKIGIITIVRVNNYGAELQAYATQKVLRDLGYDAEIKHLKDCMKHIQKYVLPNK
ncbi:polysaccharide pyruvyl transferase family protein [Pseudobutyrivibrio sp.]|uniref:polysaccharide pyruvyl transferase family protein n=1 Tax=Pseudobutyrivibrio sp. TaxID=2014367 RepID=UPI00386DBD57